MNEELLVGAGNASTAAAAGKCGESNPLTSVTWATSTPGTIPVGGARDSSGPVSGYEGARDSAASGCIWRGDGEGAHWLAVDR